MVFIQLDSGEYFDFPRMTDYFSDLIRLMSSLQVLFQ